MNDDAIGHRLDARDVALLSSVPDALHARNGVPSEETARARSRAALEAARVLGEHLAPGGMRVSPLGPAWSRDLDLHVLRPPTAQHLRQAGWVDVSPLLGALGYRGVDRWAVVADGEVVGAADIHLTAPPDPVDRILQRCRERGDVQLREVLELRVLHRAGAGLPLTDPVLVAAAGIEAALPGPAVLQRWFDGTVRPLPAALPSADTLIRRVRRRLGPLRSLTRRRIVIALGGVDGAGKSTVARVLLGSLERAGVPNGSVWSRPGMNIGWLVRLALLLKRGSAATDEPVVRAVARGTSQRPPSRRGAVGWVWSTLITLAYLMDTWRQHLAARGAVIYDRHLADALVTLDFVYGGVDLRLQRRLVRVLVPRARWVFFLDVPADVATRRKPDDVFGRHAVERQLELYRERLAQLPDVLMIDGRRDPRATVLTILHRVADDSAARTSR